MKLTKSEKLIILMLCDLQAKLEVKGEFDPNLIKSAILGGQTWALDFQYGAALNDEDASPDVVSEVCEILDMCFLIEVGYKNLSAIEKDNIKKYTHHFENDILFDGFDGNREFNHLGVARFLINKMGRYSHFASRELNSHRPSIDMYRRMLVAYRRLNLDGDKPSADQISAILKERVHPSNRP